MCGGDVMLLCFEPLNKHPFRHHFKLNNDVMNRIICVYNKTLWEFGFLWYRAPSNNKIVLVSMETFTNHEILLTARLSILRSMHLFLA